MTVSGAVVFDNAGETAYDAAPHIVTNFGNYLVLGQSKAPRVS
jgi:hypothetical protein